MQDKSVPEAHTLSNPTRQCGARRPHHAIECRRHALSFYCHPLLERVLAETVAGNGKAAHVVGTRTAEVLIDIDLGQVLP